MYLGIFIHVQVTLLITIYSDTEKNLYQWNSGKVAKWLLI